MDNLKELKVLYEIVFKTNFPERSSEEYSEKEILDAILKNKPLDSVEEENNDDSDKDKTLSMLGAK